MNIKRESKKITAILLCLSLVLGTTGITFGASTISTADPGKVITKNWTSFRGNQSHNAVKSYPVPNSASNAMLYWATKAGSGYGSSAIGSPILVNGYLYFNQGTTINKMDAVTGEIVATGKMVGNSNFSIIPPTYAKGKIFVALSNGRVQAFSAKTLKSLWLYTDKLGGQPNSPISYYDGYIYTGFWNSETRDANYVSLSIKDTNTKKTLEAKKAKWTYTSAGGFYWAGAYVNKNFLLVGTDDGQSGYTSQTSKFMVLNPKTGKVLDKVTGLNADIRSNISYDKTTGRYYFTSKGGTFYSVKVSTKGKVSGLKTLDLGGMSTSTPAVYNGRAYVGVSGEGQFAKYLGHNITVIDLSSWKIAYTAATMGYPQTSGLICTAYEKSEGYVYVYFFENMTPGKLRYIKDKKGQTTVLDSVKEVGSGNDKTEYTCAPVLFTPKGSQAQYAICSPIVDEYGTIYFKNDSAQMMALGSKITSIEVTKKPTKTVYSVGDKVKLSGIKVVANLANGKTRDISNYVTLAEDTIQPGQSDLTIYYPYQMYNDEGDSDTLFTTIDITVK